jgi:hypothetical protein
VAGTPTSVDKAATASATIATEVHGASTGVEVLSTDVDETAADVAGSSTGVGGSATSGVVPPTSVYKTVTGSAVTFGASYGCSG